MLQLADFILLSGFSIIAVLLFMLAVSPTRKVPQNILLVFLGIILLIIITVAASVYKMTLVFWATNLFEDGARFVLGPLLYIYVNSIFVKDKNPFKKHLPHFIPFLMYWLLFSLPILVGRIVGEPLFDYLSFFNGTAYLAFIKDLYLLFYIFISARLFQKFRSKMELGHPNFEDIDFAWLKRFLTAFLLVTFFDLMVVLYHIAARPELSWDIGLVSLCFLILVTVYLGYHGLKQSMVYLPMFLMNDNGKQRNKNSQNSRFVLSHEELIILQEKLDDVLRAEKPYLLQEITLAGLAEQIGTTDKKLSTLLNQSMKTSFYDFINQYRVAEVKAKLQSEEYEKYSLLGIAYSCGFNSKSSFYRAFKKETGSSPTSYKRQMAS